MPMRHLMARFARALAFVLALVAIGSASLIAKGTMLSDNPYGFELCSPEGVEVPDEGGHAGELCAFALQQAFVSGDLPLPFDLASAAEFQSAFLSQERRALVALAQKRPTFAQGPPIRL